VINCESTALKFRYSSSKKLLEFELLDQTLLPHSEFWIQILNTTQLIECIQSLRVRGAPLIGIAAVFGLAQAATQTKSTDELIKIFQLLYESRPTAVNLMNCLDLMKPLLQEGTDVQKYVDKAVEIFHQDVQLCNSLSHYGSSLIEDGDQIITHCNTGGLATAGLGTALGAILHAHHSGKKIHVYVDETRPLLQGARLTAWELQKHKVPMTLITDNMAAHLMSLKKVTKAFVGSDRIAANGDFANKIGTYGLAVHCHFHKIPFYVVAPSTTVDPDCQNGSHIHIELRKNSEVMGFKGHLGETQWAPANTLCYNPAFDVTPAELTSAWVLETGIFLKKQVDQGIFKKRNQS